MSTVEFYEWLITLAVEAGADPARARERMAQAAQTYENERSVAQAAVRKEVLEALTREGLTPATPSAAPMTLPQAMDALERLRGLAGLVGGPWAAQPRRRWQSTTLVGTLLPTKKTG